MKLYKMMFINSMILGTLITVSSYSWFTMWMGLEINLLSIIPLFANSKNINSSESSIKYFLTQALASMVLLMAVIMMLLTKEFINPLMNFYFTMMLNTALMTKLGAAPFHFWLPEVIEGLNWINSMIILTWQKIAPMMLIMNNNIQSHFLIFIIISSAVISSVAAFNQISLRKILAFSSINHIAWMLSTMLMSHSMWFIYFSIYTLITVNIIIVFNTTKSFYINQINMIMNQNKLTKFTLMMNFMSLGGLPPLIGFLPKWLVINWLSNHNLMLLVLLMIISTLLMLFIYIQMMMTSMIMSTAQMKSKTIKISKMLLMFLNSTAMVSLIMCTFLFNFY